MNLRPEVADFAQRMEFVLQENDDKSHWSGETQNILNYNLEQARQKLHDAVCGNDHGLVIKYAVHVANYSMMLADNAANKQTRKVESK